MALLLLNMFGFAGPRLRSPVKYVQPYSYKFQRHRESNPSAGRGGCLKRTGILNPGSLALPVSYHRGQLSQRSVKGAVPHRQKVYAGPEGESMGARAHTGALSTDLNSPQSQLTHTACPSTPTESDHLSFEAPASKRARTA